MYVASYDTQCLPMVTFSSRNILRTLSHDAILQYTKQPKNVHLSPNGSSVLPIGFTVRLCVQSPKGSGSWVNNLYVKNVVIGKLTA